MNNMITIMALYAVCTLRMQMTNSGRRVRRNGNRTKDLREIVFCNKAEVFDEKITVMGDGECVSPVMVWRVSVALSDHQYKSRQRRTGHSPPLRKA